MMCNSYSLTWIRNISNLKLTKIKKMTLICFLFCFVLLPFIEGTKYIAETETEGKDDFEVFIDNGTMVWYHLQFLTIPGST